MESGVQQSGDDQDRHREDDRQTLFGAHLVFILSSPLQPIALGKDQLLSNGRLCLFHKATQVVVSNVHGRDLGSFVKEAQAAIREQLVLPQGYWLEWGGQYENQVRAEQRLAIVFPVSILIIAGLLYATFHDVR